MWSREMLVKAPAAKSIPSTRRCCKPWLEALLVHFLREQLGLTGTKIGCDTSQCGACTVHLNGKALKSCTMLAIQADGAEITTIEGLGNGSLHPMQESFWENHGLQCGYCTPGMITPGWPCARRLRRTRGGNRVLLGPIDPVVDHFSRGQRSPFAGKVVCPIIEQFGRRRIERHNPFLVARLHIDDFLIAPQRHRDGPFSFS